ncbi:hypothetical protein FRB98_004159 [Tulasnella sp. 332]|nr:hypothetical protein FRB98_004159 [Tulasnella sp. 332]
MAYYVPHSQTTQAKAKIEGFQSNQNPPSPTQTFDPSSLFFNGPMFPDAFRNASAGNHSAMDFDTLMSLMPQNGDRGNINAGKHNQPGQQQQQHNQHPQQQHQHGQHQQQRSGSLNLAIPSSVYEMSHFPGLSSFQHHQNPRDDALDSPQANQGIFPDASANTTHPGQLQAHNPFAGLPSSIPQYLHNGGGTKQDSPAIGSPSETSPFPTHASHARIHGHRSPSIGPNSHSRSRSRGGTSKPPPASRNGIKITANNKRQSISSTPEEPSIHSPITSSSAASGRPQSIVIPSNNVGNGHSHHLSHEFNPHQLSSLGPHPISPLGMHSTQTAPAWFVPSQQHNSQGHVEPGSYGANGGPDGAHTTQSFAQAFSSAAAVATQQLQPRSLSLGKSPKPGTSASASVLAGNLVGATDVGGMAAMDAASKQAAILHEKRKRRRESHNAVERRRRDNINEKISELSTLLPECLLDPTGATAGGSGSANLSSTVESLLPASAGGTATTSAALSVGPEGDEKETPAMKANKGIILRKSVEYIRYLQQLVRIQANRNRELEAQLAHYNPDGMSPNNADSPSNLLSGVNGMMMNGNGSDPLSMLHSLQGLGEDDNVSMMLSHMSPDDTTLTSMGGMGGGSTPGGLPRIGEDVDADELKIKTSPRSMGGGSEEEEERGRGAIRGRRGYGTNGGATSVSVGKAGVRDDSAEMDSALSDGESGERMMDE